MRKKEYFPVNIEHPARENDAETQIDTTEGFREHEVIDAEKTIERDRAENQKATEHIRRRLKKTPKKAQNFSPEKIDAYVERNIPEHLREKPKKQTLASKVFSSVIHIKEWLGLSRVDGREHIPQEASLVVSNHSGGETGALMGAFRDHPLRITAGNELNWKRSGFRSWLLKKFGMLSINETLSNLSEEEKSKLLTRVKGKAQKRAYEKIIDGEKDGKVTPNMEVLRNALACLLRGDKVAFFPEGLFLYEDKREMRRAYGGIEILAKKYKEMTGQDLPITPVGVTKGRVGIGETITIPKDTGNLSPTDWVMTHIAEQLPEEERGYYADITAKKM